MSAEYVRDYYRVDYKRGDRIRVDGRLGTIVSFPGPASTSASTASAVRRHVTPPGASGSSRMAPGPLVCSTIRDMNAVDTCTFDTADDAIRHLIIDPIEASGEVLDAEAEFDICEIVAKVLYFESAYDEAAGVYRLDRQGWALKPEYIGEFEGNFWDVVAECAR